MRRPRIRLRTIMVVVAFIAMAMTILVQYIELRRALIREELLRAKAENDKAVAQSELLRAQALLDQINARSHERPAEPSAASLKP
jgi:hypothetical protein